MQAPKIDSRSYEDVVAETEALARSLILARSLESDSLTTWQPGSEIDAGGALVRIFGRFAEVIIERLNRVPEKSFLSFLNLIGADVTPAQSARVPLTFQLAADSPVDAYVPAGTQAAAPPAEDEEEEVIFETERDLLVTRSQLVEVCARAFNTVRDEDQFGHYTAVATGAEEADRVSFPFFAGDEIMPHMLYLACDTLLSLSEPTDVTIRFKTEAAAQLGELPFSCAYWDGENGVWRPFANRSVTLYTRALPPKPQQVLPNEFHEKVYDDPPQLVWEYFREDGWARLSVIDETETFAESGLIRFNGPLHFASRHRFGRDFYWLRVRWQAGEFTIFPKGQWIRLNTTWAAQTTTFRNELLGSSNDNPAQTFQALHQPVQLDHLLQVREMDLSETAVAQLQEAGAVSLTLDSSGSVEEVWVHWQEVPDFYGSGPNDCHYALDHLTGQIQFGDGVHGMVPPVGQNNIRLAHYRSGGGPQGNRAAETIIQLKSSLPYIDSVINYEPAMGGAPPESLDSVKRYGPRTLRHRSRAITTADIEDLAFAASFNVARARAIPPRFRPFDLWLEPDSAAPDFTQHKDVEEAGRYGLIIVPKSDAAQPVPSPDLLYRVRTKLLSQMGVTAQLWVSGPEWMEVTVLVTIVPVSLTAADYVSDLVTAALERFLHPLTGGNEGKGWKFGRRPYLSDLYALIEDVPGVDHVTALSINESPEVGQLSPEQFLIYSGTHEITVILE